MKIPTAKALILLPFVTLAVSVSVRVQKSHVGPAVLTSGGTYEGHEAVGFPGLSEYLGIRYAEGTSGSLRFMPPVAFKSSSVFNASNYGASCPYSPAPIPTSFPSQLPNFDRIYDTILSTGIDVKQVSEDCLFLNIWSKNPSSNAKRPVIVFIHGGRFISGSGNSTLIQGQSVANSGEAVFVNLNYRYTVFGFSGAPNTTQNVGILDQRLALEWIRENIERFGGDPTRITLVGHSVGGLSVDYHTYAWPEDPIASAAMSISGNAASVQPNGAAFSESVWFQLAGLLGCPTTGDAVPCMQRQSIQQLLSGVGELPFAPTKALFQPLFQETIDEIVVFSDYAERGAAGKFAKIPYLVGNLHNEAGLYKISAYLSKINLTDTQWADFNLQAFTCASAIAAANRLNNSVPIYRYRAYFDFENLRLYTGVGAYHTSDLNLWFSNAPFQSGEPNTVIEQVASEYMTNALITFASDPSNGLANKLGWPRYNLDGSASLVQLGFTDWRLASFIPPSETDTQCEAFSGDTSLGMGAM